MGAATKAMLTDEEAQAIQEAVGQGMTRQDIAKKLGWSLTCLYRRMDKDAKLKKALEVGRSIDFDFCKGILRQQAEKGSFAHMAGYMRIVHGVDITSGDGSKGSGAPAIVVNFNLGGAQPEQALDVGQLLDGEYSEE